MSTTELQFGDGWLNPKTGVFKQWDGEKWVERKLSESKDVVVHNESFADMLRRASEQKKR